MMNLALPERKTTPVPTPKHVLQRKCACGGAASMEATCEECKKESSSLQRYSASRADLATLILPVVSGSAPDPPLESASAARRFPGHDLGRVAVHAASHPTIQPKGTFSEPAGAHDQEADRIPEQLSGGRNDFAAPESAAPASRLAFRLIQRAAMPGSSPGPAP